LATFVSIKQQYCKKGASLLEFVVTAAIVAILAGFLMKSVWFYQGQAEDVAVRHVVGNVRTALDVKLAQAKLSGKTLDVALLAEENPFNWLKDKPVNYAGEYYAPSDEQIGPGNWCFDRNDKTLVYLLNNRNPLGSSQLKRLKFKVKLLSLPKDNAKPAGASSVGVAFEQQT
jgi:general secretion pathway protein G